MDSQSTARDSGILDLAEISDASHRFLAPALGVKTKAPCRAAIGRLIVCALSSCLLSAGGLAQQSQTGTLPDAPSSTSQSQTAQQKSNPLGSSVAIFQVIDRKSLVFPDLATNSGPLSAGQKFKLAANNSVSLAAIGASLIGAAYGQAIDSPEGYGQGGEGYGKRFGADMARGASDQLFGTFLISSILHSDPRFYVKKDLSFKEALKYSAVRMVITRNDAGNPTINYAGLLGPMAGETLANTYYPAGNRDVGDIFIRYASDEGWKFAANLTRQYWPTLNKRLKLLPESPQPTKKNTP